MLLIAMDRFAPSARRIDADGRLHVAVSNITKANVCPYIGREIPGNKDLGLDPDRIYYLLRDPAELAAAVDSFNNLPILSEHVPVTADNHMPELVVGSTGTDAHFDGTYITNSLVIWAQDSIDGIVNDRKRELSSAYRYIADMTPGEFEGVAFDGKMTVLCGNHVALVFEGRAGPDVIVGDEKPMALKTRTALMVQGALGALIRPQLAQDAKLNLTGLLDNVSAKSIKRKDASKKLAERAYGLVQPHLAADAALDVDAVQLAIDTAAGIPLAQDEKDEIAEDEDDDDKPAQDADADPAMDADDDDDKKPAMDAAAVDARVRAAEQRIRAEQTAIRTAEREVAPIVGELVAMDSAADVYKVGLDFLKVDTTGLPASAYGATFRAVAAAKPTAPVVAMDAAGAAKAHSDFAARYPKRMTLVRG